MVRQKRNKISYIVVATHWTVVLLFDRRYLCCSILQVNGNRIDDVRMEEDSFGDWGIPGLPDDFIVYIVL